MTTAAKATTSTRLAQVHALRSQVESLQGRKIDPPPVTIDPLLAGLLPEGGLRPGGVYGVPSTPSLLMALLAIPSQAGSWAAAIGMPTLGTEAAAHAGLALDRLVLVPSPGPRWLAVTAAVAEVLPLVAVRPPAAPRESDAARLAARLRDRGCVLLVAGDWPQTDAVFEVTEPCWSGLGDGHGYLSSREVTVTARSRRSSIPRSRRLLLPGPQGRIAEPTPRVLSAGTTDEARSEQFTPATARLLEPARLQEAG